MKVGNRFYAGKGTREEAARALTAVVLSWRDDQTLQVRGSFHGFELLSRGRTASLMLNSDDEHLPELFIRGAVTYKAQLNVENPLGTMQSVEYALRGLDKAVADEQDRAARAEKMLKDFEEHAGRPFEHEVQLKELLVRQAELNATLDLDKGERQIAQEARYEDTAAGSEDEAGGQADTPSPRAKGSSEWRRRERSVRSDNGQVDTGRKTASAVKGSIAPGTKF